MLNKPSESGSASFSSCTLPLAGEIKSTASWFAELDRLNELAGESFMANGREQPAMPPDRKVFDS